MKIKKVYSIVEIALFFMLLNVSTIYSYYFKNLSNIFLLLGGFITILGGLLSKNSTTSRKAIIILFLWSAAVIVCSVFGGFSNSSINYLIKVFIMYFIIDIALHKGIEPLAILYRVCKFMTIWAVVNYILMDILQIRFLPSVSSFSTSWGYTYNLYLGVFMENTQKIHFFGNIIKRLHVPFSEPGVAQLFFNYTLFYILFIKKNIIKKDFYILFISVLAIIMSNSLTGFLILGSQVLVYCIKHKKVFLITLLSIIVFIIGFYLIADKLSSDSYLDRSGDYIHMITNAFDNLPFGIGIGNADALEPRINNATGEYANNSNFCGLISPLLYFGVFSIIYYVILFYSFRYYSYKTDIYSKISLAAIVIITLFTEPLSLTSFFAFLELNGLVHRIKYYFKNMKMEI